MPRIAAVLLLALAACESGSATPKASRPDPTPAPTPAPAPVTVDPQVAAKSTYVRLCAPCHGADLKGYAADHAPSLVNPTFLESASDDFLRRSIIWGRPGTSMGAYGKALGGPLEDAEVARLVAYIRAQGPAAKPLPAVAKGDAARGAALYNEYCKTCHGDARTRGEAPHLANLQFLTIATDAFIRHATAKGRPGTKMLAFGSVLNDQQLDDVTAYVRQLGRGNAAVTLLPEPTGKEKLVINPRGKQPVWTPRAGRFIGVDAVAKALEEKRRMIIIDARPPSDWRRVHIAGAVSIPYHDPKRLDEIVARHKNVYVIAYCACPHHLSGIVVDELVKRGHKKALVLDEGINLWHRKGYPVTAAEGVTVPAHEPHNHGAAGQDHAGHGH